MTGKRFQKTKYGLQALLALARNYGTGPVLIADLAENERISKRFLELIFLKLKNAGILWTGVRAGEAGFFLY